MAEATRRINKLNYVLNQYSFMFRSKLYRYTDSVVTACEKPNQFIIHKNCFETKL